MRSILDELQLELSELGALVESITPVNLALSTHQDSVVQKYITVRRRFDYAAFVVALYASFEKFIENLVGAYINLESQRLKYTALPPKLLKKHLEKSADLIARARIGEGRYSEITDFQVVKNLFDCLSGADQYVVNGPAVLFHDSNFRVPQIEELFGMLGIENVCDHVRHSDAMIKWYTDIESSPQDGVRRETIVERLKDIIERRNQVAHRGTAIELLGSADMKEAIGFIEGFCNAIFAVLVSRYLKDRYTGSIAGYTGGGLVQCRDNSWYQHGQVVVVDKPIFSLSVGQPAFVIRENGARWGRIESLQLGDKPMSVVEQDTPAPQGIGIRLDFKCPKGETLYVLTSDDDVVWPPQTSAA